MLLNYAFCRDEYTEEGYFIRTMSGLTEVPADIPDEATQVYLQDNRITIIRAESFISFLNVLGCFWRITL